MQIEINTRFVQKDRAVTDGNHTILITPPISEDYYLFRIHLYKNQYLLAFPKFCTIGIGFAQEEDWNTNLPYTCKKEEIYNHIKHNKKYKEIKKSEIIKAIELLQVASMVYMEMKK